MLNALIAVAALTLAAPDAKPVVSDEEILAVYNSAPQENYFVVPLTIKLPESTPLTRAAKLRVDIKKTEEKIKAATNVLEAKLLIAKKQDLKLELDRQLAMLESDK